MKVTFQTADCKDRHHRFLLAISTIVQKHSISPSGFDS